MDEMVRVRVATEQLERWREAAGGKNKLSDWIRKVCDAALEIDIPEIPPPPVSFVGAIDVPPALQARRDTEWHLQVPKEVGVIETIHRPEAIEGKTCKHGVRKGYNCGLCGGLANVE
jgi:hypothetical protein